jgi:hypothetical protein
LGKALLIAMKGAEAGDADQTAIRDALLAALGDQADAALEAANQALSGGGGGEDVMAELSDDEKTIVASLPENMQATYMAGVKASRAAAAPVVAESEKKDDAVAAEAEKEPVAASMLSLQDLAMMAAGEDATRRSAREKMVTEAKAKGLIPESMVPVLMDESKTSDTIAASFIASRKVVTRAVPGPVAGKIATGQTQAKRDPQVSASDRIAAEALAKKTNTPVEKILARMVDEKK